MIRYVYIHFAASDLLNQVKFVKSEGKGIVYDKCNPSAIYIGKIIILYVVHPQRTVSCLNSDSMCFIRVLFINYALSTW